MFTFSTFTHYSDNASYLHIEPISADYKVKVNGEDVPVYTARISENSFNRWWPDHQRNINQSELAAYVNLVSDEALSVEVTTSHGFERAFVKPYSKAVKTETDGNTVRFTLKQNGGFVLCLDDMHNPLYIFNGKPIEPGDRSKITHYFGAGIHFTGKITLHSGDRVYLEKDALVYGCIFADGQENIEIYGNGIFDDGCEERVSPHCYDRYTNGNFKLYDCKNIRVRGVGFKNSAIFCLSIFHCTDISISDVNVFGQWRYNTDGCDIVNSHNVSLDGCFIHSFDDSVSIKGIKYYKQDDCYDIHIKGCTFWCDWGKTLTLGIETYAKCYHDISFSDCDILRGGDTACDIRSGNTADVYDVIFENIRVEADVFNRGEVLQETEEQKYETDGSTHIPKLFNLGNQPFDPEGWEVGKPLIRNVILKDMQVYFDNRIPTENGKYPLRIRAISRHDDVIFRDISVQNLTVNGKPVSQDDISVELVNVTNFEMK